MFTVNLKLGKKKRLQNFNISSNLGRMLLKAADPGKGLRFDDSLGGIDDVDVDHL